MLKLIITKFWPALIAIAIFIIWKFVFLPRIKKHPRQKKISFILIITILLSLIA